MCECYNFLGCRQASESLAKLVRARCGAMIAFDSFEACDDIFDFHACYQSAKALQIAVASTIELYVAYDTILYL